MIKRLRCILAISTLALVPALAHAQPVFHGESVEYDYASKRWFTSDDGTSIVQRDSNGVVSYFGSGLVASYGMEVLDSTLFAIEGTSIYGYDLRTATQVMQVNVPGAAFLNGLTNDGVSRLWATDFTNKKIFEVNVSSFAFPSVTEIVSATVTKPNGIVYDSAGNRLVFASWGASAPIKAVDLNGYAVTTLTTTAVGNIDGIDDDRLGHYYISSWSPVRISRYDSNFVAAAVTITAPGINNPADICYAIGIDTLGIPNGTGPATFIGFGPMVGTVPMMENPLTLSIYPNPVSEASVIAFEIAEVGPVNLEILDLEGRRVEALLEEEMRAGKHFVLLQGVHLSQGVYLLRLQSTALPSQEVIKIQVR